MRLCLDPKDLNGALEREPYYSRTVDELIAKFSGAILFTTIDMDNSDSRKLTYMALDIGRFQWKRLSMGTIIASDVLEEIGLYIGLPGVTGIADDMIIYGKNSFVKSNTISRRKDIVLSCCIKLNKQKQLKKKEVNFFGHP